MRFFLRKRCLLFCFFNLSFAFYSFASQGESSRILVHTLNYLSHDYQFAVQNGKVISEDEYKEAREFGESAVKYFNQFSPEWSKADSANIRMLIYRLDSLIESKGTFAEVSSTAIDIKNKVLAASGLKITPSVYPNLDNGKVVFQTSCSRCHGNGGYGDGPDGKTLNPKPRNLMDNERMKTLSPFFAFNTARLGVEGTGMAAHPELSDEQVWDVAFYALSFRYQKYGKDDFLKSAFAKSYVDSLSLETITTTSDEDFIKTFSESDTLKQKLLLAAIRLRQPKHENSEFLNTSLKYLDGAMELYQKGKYNEAAQLATLSYLEGIEPVEIQIKASDPRLMSHIEEQMQFLRKMITEQKPLIEVSDSLKSVRESIHAAGDILNQKQYSFWLAFVLAASVLLREGLEAFLVIMVILSILKATHLKRPELFVHLGWVVAVLIGIILWFAGGALMKREIQHMELLEGAISLLAVGMLLYVGFWLHGKSEIGKWKDYINRKMQLVTGNGSLFGLFALSFFVAFREVFESVLFLSALNIESGGTQSNAIALGIIMAFAVIIFFAFIVLQFSARLPIPKLFKISSLMMGVLSVVLAGKGIHALQETGIILIYGLPILRIELLGIFPTLETCIAQAAVIVVLVLMWNVTFKKSAKV